MGVDLQKRRLLINAIMSVVQVVVTSGILFVLYRFLIRTIGVEKLGIWSVVLSTSSVAGIANLGLAFKQNTDDIRKSPAIEIIKSLQKSGYKIQTYDPIAMENIKKELPKKNIKFCKNPFEAARNADVLALVT